MIVVVVVGVVGCDCVVVVVVGALGCDCGRCKSNVLIENTFCC